MKVRITKCSGKGFWYANRIGEVIEVTEDFQSSDHFLAMNTKELTDDKNITYLFIGKDDCQIVDGEYPYVEHDFDDLDKKIESMGITIYKMKRKFMKDGKEYITLRGVYSPKPDDEKLKEALK